MASQVRFFSGTKQQYLDLTTYNPLALYFCTDTGEMYRGDQLISDGMRVVPTHDDLPDLSCAADGILYYVHDSRNGYMVSPDRTEWLQTIYAPVHDAYIVPESEIYNTVTTVGAVRDIERKVYDRIGEVEATNAVTTETVSAIPYVYEARKYDISGTPVGTLVDYRDHEIRIMCPANTKFVHQAVGANGNPNMCYMTFKAYAPDEAVSFKEGDRGEVIDQMFNFNGPASGIDAYGRKYSVCWLALATYNPDTGEWTYFGKNSTKNKYVGWDYVVEWYNAGGIKIGFDSVRINLSNEDCHFTIQPFYGAATTEMIKETIEETVEEKIAEVVEATTAYTDEKIAEVAAGSSYQIIEF